jgi:hypothetical protein
MKDDYKVLRSQIVTLENESNWKSQIAISNIKMKLRKNQFYLSQYAIPSKKNLGASLKDLGKKWFAFTKMNNDGILLIEHLKGIKQ